MLLASIIILFSALALSLLALLDRYESAAIKSQADRRTNRPGKPIYYDAFGDRKRSQTEAKSVDSQVAA